MLYQHKGDNYRIYRMAMDASADYNAVAIPSDFNHAYKEKFDLGYQRALFEEGIRVGKAKEWRKKPSDVYEAPRVATPSAPAPPQPQPDPPAAQPAPTPEPAEPAPAGPETPPAVPNAPVEPVAMDRVSAIESATPR
jgi:hypothetical protein